MAPASTPATCPTSSTASTGRSPPAGCRAPASGSRSCGRSPKLTAARAGPSRRSAAAPRCTCESDPQHRLNRLSAKSQRCLKAGLAPAGWLRLMAGNPSEGGSMTFLTRHKRAVGAGAVAVLAIAGGGPAIPATKPSPPQAESKAAVADAASQLGISSSKLTQALQTALENRVDAAVAAGQLTAAQGKELKARIEAGEVPLLAVGAGPRGHDGPGFGHHGGPGLDAAATYLG